MVSIFDIKFNVFIQNFWLVKLKDKTTRNSFRINIFATFNMVCEMLFNLSEVRFYDRQKNLKNDVEHLV